MGFRTVAWVGIVLGCHGCVSSTVREGAIWGAAAGALTGSAIGLVASDEDLAGSPKTGMAGDMSLDVASSVVAGLAVGTIFGAIAGSIFGHNAEDPVQDAYEAQQAERAATTAAIEADSLGQNALD